MDLQLRYIEDKCKPEGQASGLFLKAYAIFANENYKGQIVQTGDVLGQYTPSIKDALTGTETTITRDKIFYLDTLYRCVIDTGVELPDLEKFSIEIQGLNGLSLRSGVLVFPNVYPIKKADKIYIGVIAVTLATYKFGIKQFDNIAKLKVTIKDNITVCHQEPKSEQPSN